MSNASLYRGARQSVAGGRMRAGAIAGDMVYSGISTDGSVWNGQMYVFMGGAPGDGRPGCAPNQCAASDPISLGACGPCCLIKILGFKSGTNGGGGTVSVLAGVTQTITQTPTRDFLPFLVTVPSSIAEFFEISKFSIGSENAIDDGGSPILAQTISEVATYHMLSIGCIAGARPIAVTFQNVDPALDAHIFYLTMFGYALT